MPWTPLDCQVVTCTRVLIWYLIFRVTHTKWLWNSLHLQVTLHHWNESHEKKKKKRKPLVLWDHPVLQLNYQSPFNCCLLQSPTQVPAPVLFLLLSPAGPTWTPRLTRAPQSWYHTALFSPQPSQHSTSSGTGQAQSYRGQTASPFPASSPAKWPHHSQQSPPLDAVLQCSRRAALPIRQTQTAKSVAQNQTKSTTCHHAKSAQEGEIRQQMLGQFSSHERSAS